MAPIDKSAVIDLLDNGPHRTLVGGKQLTLAFAGLYFASTTLSAKPQLVWENDKTPYARYYVPIESLHADIKAHLRHSNTTTASGVTNGYAKGAINLEQVETLKGKANDSEAVTERLSIGEKSTTWVRFVEGPLKGFIRFERDEIDDWFENGAIFAGIKNPYKRIDTTPIARNIVVKVDGEAVAESSVAALLNETGLKEAYYLPATSIKDWGAVEKSSWRTACPYKGEAWYLNLTLKGKKYENLIWYYPYPTHESAGIEGFISFYNKEGVDILVDGIKV